MNGKCRTLVILGLIVVSLISRNSFAQAVSVDSEWVKGKLSELGKSALEIEELLGQRDRCIVSKGPSQFSITTYDVLLVTMANPKCKVTAANLKEENVALARGIIGKEKGPSCKINIPPQLQTNSVFTVKLNGTENGVHFSQHLHQFSAEEWLRTGNTSINVLGAYPQLVQNGLCEKDVLGPVQKADDSVKCNEENGCVEENKTKSSKAG